MRVRRLIYGATFVGSLAVISVLAGRQNQAASPAAIPASSKPLALHQPHDRQDVVRSSQRRVDGSVTPELISDELAYRHFFMALTTGSAADLHTRKSFIRRIGLSDPDEAKFMTAVTSLQGRLNGLENRRKSLEFDGAPAAPVLAELRAERNSLLAEVAMQVRSSLTAEGSEAFASYIRDNVKRRIVLYDWPENMRVR